MTSRGNLSSFVRSLGLDEGQHVIVHVSFRRVRSTFPYLTIEELIGALQDTVTPLGSIIIPTFTYCFKRTDGTSTIFNRTETPSVVGGVSEVFRQMSGVVRTSSPTHSFGLWGKAANGISSDNNPTSPLGEGSVLDWLVRQPDSCVLMLGTNFSSLSLGHYIETKTPVPWANYSPWPNGDCANVGVSEAGETPLREVPRCSKQFVAFEEYLLARGLLHRQKAEALHAYCFPTRLLLSEGLRFFQEHARELLCPAGECELCDARREKFLPLFYP
jgi:aminoglycoside 3-N-acetyltransferase